jgi:hypothetical protein
MMFSRSLNIEQIERLVDLRRAMPRVAARALNRTGAKAVTLMVRELTAQTGLARKTIKRAVKSHRASERQLTFALKTRGGNISLRYFKPRETMAGVSANVLGQRIVVPHTFMKAGRFPNRVRFDSKGRGRGMDGNVFIRAGKGRLPIAGGRSGVYIPTEMLQGRSLATFDTLVASDLPVQVDRAIGDALRGY